MKKKELEQFVGKQVLVYARNQGVWRGYCNGIRMKEESTEIKVSNNSTNKWLAAEDVLYMIDVGKKSYEKRITH